VKKALDTITKLELVTVKTFISLVFVQEILTLGDTPVFVNVKKGLPIIKSLELVTKTLLELVLETLILGDILQNVDVIKASIGTRF
jgi:hypothetical protein